MPPYIPDQMRTACHQESGTCKVLAVGHIAWVHTSWPDTLRMPAIAVWGTFSRALWQCACTTKYRALAQPSQEEFNVVDSTNLRQPCLQDHHLLQDCRSIPQSVIDVHGRSKALMCEAHRLWCASRFPTAAPLEWSPPEGLLGRWPLQRADACPAQVPGCADWTHQCCRGDTHYDLLWANHFPGDPALLSCPTSRKRPDAAVP